MNLQETAATLAVIGSIDNREPSQVAAQAWHECLAEIPYGEAREAVRLFRQETKGYIEPADVIAIVRREREKRSREGRKLRQIESVRAIETSVEANRNARLNRIKACGGCDESGRLLGGRFCSHVLEGL